MEGPTRNNKDRYDTTFIIMELAPPAAVKGKSTRTNFFHVPLRAVLVKDHGDKLGKWIKSANALELNKISKNTHRFDFTLSTSLRKTSVFIFSES